MRITFLALHAWYVCDTSATNLITLLLFLPTYHSPITMNHTFQWQWTVLMQILS